MNLNRSFPFLRAFISIMIKRSIRFVIVHVARAMYSRYRGTGIRLQAAMPARLNPSFPGLASTSAGQVDRRGGPVCVPPPPCPAAERREQPRGQEQRERAGERDSNRILFCQGGSPRDRGQIASGVEHAISMRVIQAIRDCHGAARRGCHEFYRHFHATLKLDGATGDGDTWRIPPFPSRILMADFNNFWRVHGVLLMGCFSVGEGPEG